MQPSVRMLVFIACRPDVQTSVRALSDLNVIDVSCMVAYRLEPFILSTRLSGLSGKLFLHIGKVLSINNPEASS